MPACRAPSQRGWPSANGERLRTSWAWVNAFAWSVTLLGAGLGPVANKSKPLAFEVQAPETSEAAPSWDPFSRPVVPSRRVGRGLAARYEWRAGVVLRQRGVPHC